MSALTDIIEKVNNAEDLYGPFMSTHEAYGVIAEELSELLDAIRSNDLHSIGKEAEDVAAGAYRLAEQIRNASDEFVTRSGCDG